MVTVEEALADPDLFAISAVAILTDKFGIEFVNWEQETVEMEIRGLCSKPDEGLLDKIAAASTVISTDIPHWDTIAFNNITQIFNFDNIETDSFIPASLEDLLWGCAEIRLLEGPEDYKKAGFSPDIKAYVGTLLVQHGITTPPSVLEFADISESMILNRDDNLGADSIMFETYWEEQRDITKDMEDFVITRTNKLLSQLVSLPIKGMDNDFIAAVKDTLSVATQE